MHHFKGKSQDLRHCGGRLNLLFWGLKQTSQSECTSSCLDQSPEGMIEKNPNNIQTLCFETYIISAMVEQMFGESLTCIVVQIQSIQVCIQHKVGLHFPQGTPNFHRQFHLSVDIQGIERPCYIWIDMSSEGNFSNILVAPKLEWLCPNYLQDIVHL